MTEIVSSTAYNEADRRHENSIPYPCEDPGTTAALIHLEASTYSPAAVTLDQRADPIYKDNFPAELIGNQRKSRITQILWDLKSCTFAGKGRRVLRQQHIMCLGRIWSSQGFQTLILTKREFLLATTISRVVTTQHFHPPRSGPGCHKNWFEGSHSKKPE